METSLPLVWFERPVLTEHEQFLSGRLVALGPAANTPDDPLSALPEARGAVASMFAYNDELFDRAPNLLVVARTGIGYDTVDVDSATRHGVAVCNVPSGPTISTAEHTVGLMIAAAKQIKRSELALRAGGSGFYERHIGIELEGKTLGLVGFGRIPRRVAAVAVALGMHVIAHDPFVTDFEGLADGRSSLAGLLGDADVVSVHIPHTPDTHKLFSDDTFAMMRPGAVFINTARGGIVDLSALERALDSGQVFAAGLDVTDPEPLPPDATLLARDDIIITPHVAAGTPEAKERNFAGALDQVLEVIAGSRPAHLVNPDVWPAVQARIESQKSY